MARYTEAVCRLCRRENQKLFLKGDKCFSGKCPQEKRSYAPGQHGQARTRKPSEYSLQLREKQKTKRFYGISESQMEKYFNMATKRKGITGENMLAILESRLDNVVYRMGLAMSRPEARQLVNHAHFKVNGHKVKYVLTIDNSIHLTGKILDYEDVDYIQIPYLFLFQLLLQNCLTIQFLHYQFGN